MHAYRVCGLTVRSEIDLPGLIAIPPSETAPDVTIRKAAVPAELEGATDHGPTWQIAGDRFLFQIPGVARFLLTAGRDIAFEADAGTPEHDVAIFIIGTVFGILLHQRDHIVLHASAVRVNGKAVLFCGASGAGKSTIAAALGRRGYDFVSDDVSAITLTPAGVPMVQPDGRQLKLWAHSIEQLELAGARGLPVRNRLEKFYVEPSKAFAQALPMGAVYALRETRPPQHDGIERPNIVDAALVIRRNAYRPRMVVAMQQKAQYFQSAVNIAAKAGVFFFTRPLDFARVDDGIAQLEAHWRQIGLLESAP
jgi:hypothetical protein